MKREKVDFRWYKTMMEISHIIVDTTPSRMKVAEKPPVCMGVADTLSDCNRMAGTLPIVAEITEWSNDHFVKRDPLRSYVLVQQVLFI